MGNGFTKAACEQGFASVFKINKIEILDSMKTSCTLKQCQERSPEHNPVKNIGGLTSDPKFNPQSFALYLNTSNMYYTALDLLLN